MTEQQRLGAALVLFLLASLLAVTVSAVVGAVVTVLAVGVLLWGRKLGDRRPPRR